MLVCPTHIHNVSSHCATVVLCVFFQNLLPADVFHCANSVLRRPLHMSMSMQSYHSLLKPSFVAFQTKRKQCEDIRSQNTLWIRQKIPLTISGASLVPLTIPITRKVLQYVLSFCSFMGVKSTEYSCRVVLNCKNKILRCFKWASYLVLEIKLNFRCYLDLFL